MESTEELKKWIDSLTMGERRFVHAQSKARSRSEGGQTLELMLWLESTDDVQELPGGASFVRNLPVVAHRLRELVLDCLHLLHKHADGNATLRTLMDDVALLMDRNLTYSASFKLRRAKREALTRSKYLVVLQCIEWERRIIRAERGKDWLTQLGLLYEEQQTIMRRLKDFCLLEQIMDELRARTRQVLTPPQGGVPTGLLDADSISMVEKSAQSLDRLESALAIHVLGMRDLFLKQFEAAQNRYERLFVVWEQEPAWLMDQGDLLLSILNLYQLTCFFSPLNWEEVQAKLHRMPKLAHLRGEQAYHFERRIHLYSFALALNSGKLELASSLVPEIMDWLGQNQRYAIESHILPFLNNFAVAEFLNGNLAAAHRHVVAILNTPNRKVRQDIREFALVLQLILQYEMGEDDFLSSLLRSVKRHFKSQLSPPAYALPVVRYLEDAVGAEADKVAEARLRLMASLQASEEAAPTHPTALGHTEVNLWLRALHEGRSLREVFLEAIDVGPDEPLQVT